MDKVRIDKWLWAVRIFKTRQISSDMCKRGRVSVNAQKAKPSRMISKGERVSVTIEGFSWIYEVAGCIEKRVSAKIAGEFRKDLTPEEDFKKIQTVRASRAHLPRREKGSGRPTKKERRRMDDFVGKIEYE